jgi:hypothetical protein
VGWDSEEAVEAEGSEETEVADSAVGFWLSEKSRRIFERGAQSQWRKSARREERATLLGAVGFLFLFSFFVFLFLFSEAQVALKGVQGGGPFCFSQHFSKAENGHRKFFKNIRIFHSLFTPNALSATGFWGNGLNSDFDSL